MADIRVKDLGEASVPGADYYLLTDSATDGVKKVKTTNVVKPADIGAVAVGGALGTPSSGDATNLTGTAAGLTAGNVTTNANLTGDVTSVGNATTIAASAVTNAKLANAADGTIKSNISGASAAPSDNTISTVLDKLLGTTQGSVIYRGISSWASLPPGTSGQYLQTLGPSANPAWNTPAGGGDMLAANNLTDVNVIATGAGAVARTAASKLRDIVSVKDFGAIGDGTTADDTAFSNAAALGRRIYVPQGTYLIANNLTLGQGSFWIIDEGAMLTVASGKTLTINSVVESGYSQIFSGAGTVLGVRHVRPEWFGAVRDGTTDDAPAFQKAENCMEAGTDSDGHMLFELQAGTYRIASTITIILSANYRVHWKGMGGSGATLIQGAAAFTGTSVLLLPSDAGNASKSQATFEGFEVRPETIGSGATSGITIGTSGAATLQGGIYEAVIFRDVSVNEFSRCWGILNARLLSFERCASWISTLASGTCLFMYANAATDVIGDSDFRACQFVATASSGAIASITANVSGSLVTGIRFNACIFYTGTITITANAGGAARDFWFDSGWQYDSIMSGGAFIIGANGASSLVSCINIKGGYFSGGATAVFVNAFTISSGKVQGIMVQNNYFVGSSGDCLTFGGVQGINVDNNMFVDANGGSLVSLNTCSSVSVGNNTASRRTTTNSFSYFVTNVAGSNYYCLTNNNSGGFGGTVNDPSPGANKTVSGNI